MSTDKDTRYKPIWSDNPLCIDTQPDSTELVDALNKRLSHLRAMAAMTYGEQGKAFRGFNKTIQDDYMWALSDMVDETQALFQAYSQQK